MMNADYGVFFKTLTGFTSHAYQRRVAAALLGRRAALLSGLGEEVNFIEASNKLRLPDNGRNVLLRAPTGSGKTWGVLSPFIFSRMHNLGLFDRVLYAVPLRSLADGLYRSTASVLEKSACGGSSRIRLQTGETGAIHGLGDPSLSEGHIIFATIDQILSSYLNIPFALSPRQANLNAGALIGSLIIFDEFHLLDPNRSLRTGILLAQHLSKLVQVVWMTATQPRDASIRLAHSDRLDAVSLGVPDEELSEIVSQRGKKRGWVWCPRSLSADEVWQGHRSLPSSKRRTLVVVNTVNRAQKIYSGIKQLAGGSAKVRLLHSRYLPEHRMTRQVEVVNAFARGSSEEMILVATQVIEAGLDISASCLYSELAPANALVQRAGRCARFEGEDGTVFVFDTQDDKAGRSYRPYAAKPSSRVTAVSQEIADIRFAIDQTAVEIEKLSGRELSFLDEADLVDRIHTSLDLSAIESFNALEWRRLVAEAMTPVPDYGNYGLAADLIRDVDSVALLLANETRLSDPHARLAPRYKPVAISVPRLSLVALWRYASEQLPHGTWTLRAPIFKETERGDGFCSYEVIASSGQSAREWLLATYRPGPLVLNPLLGRYSDDLGLELGAQSLPTDWQSEGLLTQDEVDSKRGPYQRYCAETFQHHVNFVRQYAQALCGDKVIGGALLRHDKSESVGDDFWLSDHSAGLNRLDSRYQLPAETAKDLAILAAVLHDTGKLTRAWQLAVSNWQELKASSRDHYRPGPDGDKQFAAARSLLGQGSTKSNLFLAHSDYDANWRWPDGQLESDVERRFKRPNHALEGAWLALPLIAHQVDRVDFPTEQLAKATLSAIGRHHTPHAGCAQVNRSEPLPAVDVDAAAEHLMRAVVNVRDDFPVLQNEQPAHSDWEDFLSSNVRFELKPGRSQDRGDDWHWWPFSMVLVRVVRLADQLGTAQGITRVGL